MVGPEVRCPSKRKVNPLHARKIASVDWKDVGLLRAFISERGKIRARRVTGLTPSQQRQVASAIRNAREMALLPYPSPMVGVSTSQRGGYTVVRRSAPGCVTPGSAPIHAPGTVHDPQPRPGRAWTWPPGASRCCVTACATVAAECWWCPDAPSARWPAECARPARWRSSNPAMPTATRYARRFGLAQSAPMTTSPAKR